MKNYIIGITGASGVIYGVRIIEELLKLNCNVNVIVTDAGKVVLEDEIGIPFNYNNSLFKENFCNMYNNNKNLKYFEINDIKAPIASGSYKVDSMVIIPCSMSTLSCVANGMSGNLLERAADVTLKENRQLIIVPRETPLSSIHLKNMLTLSQYGVRILPAMPGFYSKPVNLEDVVNFIVGKTLDMMGIDNNCYNRWQ